MGESILNTLFNIGIAIAFIRMKIVNKPLRFAVPDYYATRSESLLDKIKKALNYLRCRLLVMFPDFFQEKSIEEPIEVLMIKNFISTMLTAMANSLISGKNGVKSGFAKLSMS